MTVGITNLDMEPFPFGLGWHPYLAWRPDYRVLHAARWWWPHDGEYLPTGSRVALNGADPLQDSRTAYLADWTRVDIDRGEAAALSITASTCMSHLVIHRAPQNQYVCVEPVTHLANAFNTAEREWDQTGVRFLKPGESASGWIEVRITTH
ncbi:hypothetical protein BB934_37995 (plasmid) [Microvirga ossetica]|uniref:Aldose epimerase n=1 Tax=Microvirga ossetica TaxID=1882682 RepID=A0A1B2EVQ8_9HYPH|nr:hypothetical protein BB934_37995 [Microvirga ossetica]